jgi:hypothetical protein
MIFNPSGSPPDPSGKFDEFKVFVISNSEICEWVGLLVVATQVRFFCTPAALELILRYSVVVTCI